LRVANIAIKYKVKKKIDPSPLLQYLVRFSLRQSLGKHNQRRQLRIWNFLIGNARTAKDERETALI